MTTPVLLILAATGLAAGRCFRLLDLIDKHPEKVKRYVLEAVILTAVVISGAFFIPLN